MSNLRALDISIAASIQNTKNLRVKIVQAINEEQPTMGDGIIALLCLAAGHSKDCNIELDEFLVLCSSLYQGCTIVSTGQDEILLPEDQNN